MVDWQYSASVFRDGISASFCGEEYIFFTHENSLVAQMKTTSTRIAWAGKVYEQSDRSSLSSDVFDLGEGSVGRYCFSTKRGTNLSHGATRQN